MDFSCERFFAIQELLVMLADHLESTDLFNLIQTSKHLNTTFAPHFYRYLHLDLHESDIKSGLSLSSLSRHAQDVRGLSTNLVFVQSYYNGRLAKEEMDSSASGKTYQRPAWLPPPNRVQIDAVPVPSMFNLTRLDLQMNYDAMIRATRADIGTQESYHRQVYWIISLCPHLEALLLRAFHYIHVQDFSAFGRSISGLSKLPCLQWWVLIGEYAPGVCRNPDK
ncbi:hypothetical protein BGX33_003257 [Mortierella sp. NVP41]|nr:hypothetical protein BGX33_003257 [Mortierella sp. NVP41]